MVVKQEDTLIIKLAESPKEWKDAATLLAEKYYKEFGVYTPPAKEIVICIYKGEVVGTVGIEFSVHGTFSLEQYVKIKESAIRDFRNKLAEFTRWASRHPSAGALSLFGLSMYALKKKKQYAIFSVKEKQLQHLKLLGATVSILPSSIKRTEIPSCLTEYYMKQPYPQIAMVKVSEFRDVFQKIVSELQSKGMSIIIDL